LKEDGRSYVLYTAMTQNRRDLGANYIYHWKTKRLILAFAWRENISDAPLSQMHYYMSASLFPNPHRFYDPTTIPSLLHDKSGRYQLPRTAVSCAV